MTTERMTEGAATGTAEGGPADAAATGTAQPPRAATSPTRAPPPPPSGACPQRDALRRPAPSRSRASAPTRSARRSSARAWTSSSATRAASSCRSTTSGTLPELRHVLVRHEQGAAHAADGYARAAGESACAWAHPDPGATNLVTGIATAQPTRSRWSRSPATCPARSSARTRSRIDTRGITLPMTKHN